MPQRDRYHELIKAALIADGWIVTHDPYFISLGERRAFIDLGAERPIAAQLGDRKIAVEIKSFTGPSPMADLEAALGQYLLYRSWMAGLIRNASCIWRSTRLPSRICLLIFLGRQFSMIMH